MVLNISSGLLKKLKIFSLKGVVMPHHFEKSSWTNWFTSRGTLKQNSNEYRTHVRIQNS